MVNCNSRTFVKLWMVINFSSVLKYNFDYKCLMKYSFK